MLSSGGIVVVLGPEIVALIAIDREGAETRITSTHWNEFGFRRENGYSEETTATGNHVRIHLQDIRTT